MSNSPENQSPKRSRRSNYQSYISKTKGFFMVSNDLAIAWLDHKISNHAYRLMTLMLVHADDFIIWRGTMDKAFRGNDAALKIGIEECLARNLISRERENRNVPYQYYVNAPDVWNLTSDLEPKKSEDQKSEDQKSEDQKSEDQKSGLQKSGLQKSGLQKSGLQKSGLQKNGLQKSGGITRRTSNKTNSQQDEQEQEEVREQESEQAAIAAPTTKEKVKKPKSEKLIPTKGNPEHRQAVAEMMKEAKEAGLKINADSLALTVDNCISKLGASITLIRDTWPLAIVGMLEKGNARPAAAFYNWMRFEVNNSQRMNGGYNRQRHGAQRVQPQPPTEYKNNPVMSDEEFDAIFGDRKIP
jgi:hypothetical protein